MPEGKNKAIECFTFPCSLLLSSSDAITVSQLGDKNKSCPLNTWCKITPASENAGLCFYHPLKQTFFVDLFWLWKHKTCHSYTLKREEIKLTLEGEDEKVFYPKQKSDSVTFFFLFFSTWSALLSLLIARDQFLSAQRKDTVQLCVYPRGISLNIYLTADFQ